MPGSTRWLITQTNSRDILYSRPSIYHTLSIKIIIWTRQFHGQSTALEIPCTIMEFCCHIIFLGGYRDCTILLISTNVVPWLKSSTKGKKAQWYRVLLGTSKRFLECNVSSSSPLPSLQMLVLKHGIWLSLSKVGILYGKAFRVFKKMMMNRDITRMSD